MRMSLQITPWIPESETHPVIPQKIEIIFPWSDASNKSSSNTTDKTRTSWTDTEEKSNLVKQANVSHILKTLK